MRNSRTFYVYLIIKFDNILKLFLLLASILILSVIGIQGVFAEENFIPIQLNTLFDLQINQTAFFESESYYSPWLCGFDQTCFDVG